MVGNTKDAIVILAVVVINALFGFYQEYRAERSLAALKDMLPVTARVGATASVEESRPKNVVPGDVFFSKRATGSQPTVGCSLAASLEIDESASDRRVPAGRQARSPGGADARSLSGRTWPS